MYHAGALRAITGGREMGLVVSMPPNPSHLEAIDPFVEGLARAAGTLVDAPGAPVFDPTRSLPILIHGDASFPGQAIVAETLNLSRLPGYPDWWADSIIVKNHSGSGRPGTSRRFYAAGSRGSDSMSVTGNPGA